MHKTKKFLIKDLEEHGCQMSWDLEADARFAHAVGDFQSEQYVIKAIEDGQTAFPKDAGLLSTGISRRRIRVLNALVNMKLVTSYWLGTSKSGSKNYGTNRVRVYQLATTETKCTDISKVKQETPLSTKIGYTSSISKRVLLKRRPK